MRASMGRYKFRLQRFVHHNFFPVGSTMVLFPLMRFERRYPENRAKLAAALREYRKQHGRFVDKTSYRD